jgi:hypothetical protein
MEDNSGWQEDPQRGSRTVSEQTIFLAVLEIDDPAERAAYLDSACDVEQRTSDGLRRRNG